MNNKDWYDYFLTYKNPLDKKYRWEVNVSFKKKHITEAQRIELLKIDPFTNYQLSLCVRNKVSFDVSRVGNFYRKRAANYNDRKINKMKSNIMQFCYE